jgi:hypothetical protein
LLLIEIKFRTKRRISMNKYRTKLLIAMQLCAVVLLTSFTATSASAETSATAAAKETVTLQSGVDDVTPPQVPDNIKVTEDGVIPFLVGHADGTQNYVCKPSGAGFAYALFTPEATLFNGHDKQLITHYFSPNPQEANTDPRVDGNLMIRATWQHLDTSTIWAGVHKNGAAIVDPDSVAWLLLDVVGNLDGPTGGATLSPSLFVQRVNTIGGNPPKTGCSSSADVGKEAFVHYKADYFFWKKADQ